MNINLCFILMPFSEAEVKDSFLQEKELNYIYEKIIKRAVEEFLRDDTVYFKNVSRFNSKIGSIVSGIIANIESAELVIADLSGLNPNVMYELGVRHSLKRGTIIVSQDLSKLPSDLRDYFTVEYVFAPDRVIDFDENYEKFKIQLHKAIDELLDTNKYDSPVLSYFEETRRFKREKDIEYLKELEIIIECVEEELADVYMIIEDIDFEEEKTSNILPIIMMKVNNMVAMLGELRIPLDTTLYTNLVSVRNLLSDVQKSFFLTDYFSTIGNSLGSAVPEELTSLNLLLDKSFINPFLFQNEEKPFITFKEIFEESESGILAKKLFLPYYDYMDSLKEKLGIGK